MNKSKLGLVTVMGTLCLGLTLAGVACTGGGATNEVPAEDVSGVVHFLERGEPTDSLGETGDACLVATSGEFFRKTENGWKYEDLTSYAVNDGVLNVSFKSGENENYSLIDEGTTEVGHVHTYGDTYTIYEAKCIIPGIAVKYCTTCKYAFPVVLAVQPGHHDIDEDNYGKCKVCGKLQDGTKGFEVKPQGTEENAKISETQLSDVFNKAVDGDTIIMQGETEISADSQLSFSDKGLTIDVRGHDFTLKKDDCTEGAPSNITVGAGGSLTITDSSSDNSGSLSFEIPLGGGNGGGTSRCLEAIGEVDNRAQLEFKDIKVNINDNNMTNIVMVTANADVVFGEDTVFNINGVAQTIGIYANTNSNLTIDGAQINAEGDVVPFIVGGHEQGATLTLKSGEINLKDAGDSMFAVQVNGGGNFIMEGGKIEISGDMSAKIEDSTDCSIAIGIENRYSNGTIYQSQVNLMGGEIVLAPTKGTAMGIVAWPGMSEIHLACKITCNATEEAFAFAMTISSDPYDEQNHSTLILQDGCEVEIKGDSAYNRLYDGKKQGTAPAQWQSGNTYIFDKTTDKRFGEKNKEKFGGLFIQPYVEG